MTTQDPQCLYVIYRRSRNLGSILIRFGAWGSQWSHVGILARDGMVIEASAKHGVVRTNFRQFLDKSSKYEFAEIECPDVEAALLFAEAQVGKPYDWGGIFGILFREPWQSENRWFCFELLEAALIAGGRTRFRKGINRITGNLSYLTL